MAGQQDTSFILQLQGNQQAAFISVSESCVDLLGYEAQELLNTPFFDIVHPEDQQAAQVALMRMLQLDLAATVVILRLRHRSGPTSVYALSACVVMDRIVGSLATALPVARAMFRNNSAGEVHVIAPGMIQALAGFQRWDAPRPLLQLGPATVQRNVRTYLKLDRYTNASTIQEISNEQFLSRGALGRSFLDFVRQADVGMVRDCITAAKTWGASQAGMMSDGGFAYIRFLLLTTGRNGDVPTYTQPLIVDAILWGTVNGVIMILRGA